MNKFDACSRWRECSKVMKCIHPGTKEYPPSEFTKACTTAQNYLRGINHFAKNKSYPVETNKTCSQHPNESLLTKHTSLQPEQQIKKLLIIDGNSILHKAFYGTSLLSAPDGRFINAVYGALRTIITAVMSRRPTHLLVAMDHPGAYFRHSIYPQYKANRKETPPELIPQLSLFREVMKRTGIRFIEKKGFEADDIIGTVANMAAKEGYHVEILTSDKDCIQLVTDKVTVLLHKKGRFEECTPHTTPLLTGFFHYNTIDLKALAGDVSDNIPGVSRIGTKTALILLKKYGTLDSIIAMAKEGKIPGKIGENIRNHVGSAIVSRRLATIETNVPLEISTESFKLPLGGPKHLNLTVKYLSTLGIKVLKIDVLFTTEETSITEDQQTYIGIDIATARVQIKIQGNNNVCGICQSKKDNCSEFLELNDDGRLFFGTQSFFACSDCRKLLHPKLYLEVPGKSPRQRNSNDVKESNDSIGYLF
ncbi:5'-3' exonuclease [Desulfoscipio gibsoniae]